MNMVVFTIFFGELAKVPSDGIPYPIFSYTGLLPWIFFASALEVSARSMLHSGSMVSKIYFPRIIVPLSSVFANLVDFAHLFCHPYRYDDLLPDRANDQLVVVAIVLAAGNDHCHGSGIVVLGVTGDVPRRELPAALHYRDLEVRITGGLFSHA